MTSSNSAVGSESDHTSKPPPAVLKRTLGVFAVLASAVAAEYGSGVNTLLSSALGAQPGITYLLPLAVVIAGLLLLPSVLLYARFAKAISAAGSAYVWMTTSLGPLTGFVVGFVYFVGVLGSMGFLAYIFSTFIATFCDGVGASAAAVWCSTPTGKFTMGVVLIFGTLLMHLRGAKMYGRIISYLFFGVLLAAVTTVYYGITTPPGVVVSKVSAAMGTQLTPPLSSTPSMLAFLSVLPLFVYLYGGISAVPSLGGESSPGQHTLSKGIFSGWLIALILYTVVAFSLFNAVPWWVVHPAVTAGKGALMTVPGLIGMMAPTAVSLVFKALIIVIAGKTVAPLMFDCSRNLFAWAVDGRVPRAFSRTNSTDVPYVALLTVAGLTVLFLAESVYGGFQIGVALRSISLMLVSVVVGIGALRIVLFDKFAASPLRVTLLNGGGLIPVASISIVIGVVLIALGLYQPGLPIWLQPGVQALIAAVLALLIYFFRQSRQQT